MKFGGTNCRCGHLLLVPPQRPNRWYGWGEKLECRFDVVEASPNCCILLKQALRRAASREVCTAGSNQVIRLVRITNNWTNGTIGIYHVNRFVSGRNPSRKVLSDEKPNKSTDVARGKQANQRKVSLCGLVALCPTRNFYGCRLVPMAWVPSGRNMA